MNEEETDKKFNELIGKLDDNQFWAYIRSWKEEESLCDQMREWDTETKKREIKKLKELMLRNK